MSLPKLSISRHLPAEAEATGRSRTLDVFGHDFEVPSGFAPQWVGNLEPLLPLVKNTLGPAFDGLDLDDTNVADLIRSDAAKNIKAGDILDAMLDRRNWTLVKSCLVGSPPPAEGEPAGDGPEGLLTAVFGEQVPALMALNLSTPEWLALARTLGEAWGVGLGELLRPPSSSAADGTTSKPTSNAGTASTRAKRSGSPARRAGSRSAV